MKNNQSLSKGQNYTFTTMYLNYVKMYFPFSITNTFFLLPVIN